MELNGCAAFLKAGCVFADRLSTVSPSYADEICTPYYGEGLEGILSARRHQLSGILNGIDKKVFNPYTDQLIAKRYDKGHLKGKQACKESADVRHGPPGRRAHPARRHGHAHDRRRRASTSWSACSTR